jgi:hypothetical protein
LTLVFGLVTASIIPAAPPDALPDVVAVASTTLQSHGPFWNRLFCDGFIAAAEPRPKRPFD